MKIDSQLILNSFLILAGALFIIYAVYGRIKRKPLFLGDYKPGKPGYNEFLKIVNNNWYLLVAVLVFLFSTIDFIINASIVLNNPYSKAILIAAPVIAITTCLITFWMTPYVVGTKVTKSKNAGKK